jgi:hypothetical protein
MDVYRYKYTPTFTQSLNTQFKTNKQTTQHTRQVFFFFKASHGKEERGREKNVYIKV